MGYSPIMATTVQAVLEQLGVDKLEELEEKEQERVIEFCEDLTNTHWDEFNNRFYDELTDLKKNITLKKMRNNMENNVKRWQIVNVIKRIETFEVLAKNRDEAIEKMISGDADLIDEDDQGYTEDAIEMGD